MFRLSDLLRMEKNRATYGSPREGPRFMNLTSERLSRLPRKNAIVSLAKLRWPGSSANMRVRKIPYDLGAENNLVLYAGGKCVDQLTTIDRLLNDGVETRAVMEDRPIKIATLERLERDYVVFADIETKTQGYIVDEFIQGDTVIVI
jgi:hypothetical protein